MKRIMLKLDDEMFRKFKVDKAKKEAELGKNLTWEEYSALAFGFSKYQKGGQNGRNS